MMNTTTGSNLLGAGRQSEVVCLSRRHRTRAARALHSRWVMALRRPMLSLPLVRQWTVQPFLCERDAGAMVVLDPANAGRRHAYTPFRRCMPPWLQQVCSTTLSVAGLFIVLAMAGLAQGATPKKPNIIFFINDDQIRDQVGCYGGNVLTPHLDRLAREGI